MKHLIFTALCLGSLFANACDDVKIPIEVLNEYNLVPSEEHPARKIILAPLTFDGWVLNVAQFNKGPNSIKIAKYLSDTKYPEKAAFFIKGTKEFLEDSHVLVSYKELVSSDSNGNLKSGLCMHVERVDL